MADNFIIPSFIIPTVVEVRVREKRKADAQLQKERDQTKKVEKVREDKDRKLALPIIEQLTKMFIDENVSSVEGCRISGITNEHKTSGALRVINEFLGGEWVANFEENTGNAHDFEILSTLVVKPNK